MKILKIFQLKLANNYFKTYFMIKNKKSSFVRQLLLIC
jgi:hypothetical protein